MTDGMGKLKDIARKIEYELFVFLILAAKLPPARAGKHGLAYYTASLAAALVFGFLFRRSPPALKKTVFFLQALLLCGDLMPVLLNPAYLSAGFLLRRLASSLAFFAALLAAGETAAPRAKTLKAFVPVLCAFGVLANPGFLFFYLPAVLAVLLAAGAGDGGKKKIPAVTLAACALPAAFLIRFHDIRALLIVFDAKRALVSVAALLPLALAAGAVWRGLFASKPTGAARRAALLGVLTPAVAFAFNFFFTYKNADGWQYAVYAAVFAQMCLIMRLVAADERTMAAASFKTGSFLERKPWLVLAGAVYIIQFADVVYGR